MMLDGRLEKRTKEKVPMEARTVSYLDSGVEKHIRDDLSNALSKKSFLEKLFGKHSDEHLRDLEAKYSEPDGALVVVERGKEVVGFLAIRIEDGVGRVDQMRWDKADPETIRVLLGHAETLLKDKGVGLMSVTASERLDEILEILRYRDFQEAARDDSSRTYQKYL